MLDNINSIYIYLISFSFIEEKIKLEITKYNKKFKKKLNINLINYKLFSGKYVIYGENNTAKEYNIFNNHLIFEGEYLNGKRWNGSLFSQKDDTIYIFEDACGCCSEHYNDDKIKIEGKTLNLIRKRDGMRYYTSNNKH